MATWTSNYVNCVGTWSAATVYYLTYGIFVSGSVPYYHSNGPLKLSKLIAKIE